MTSNTLADVQILLLEDDPFLGDLTREILLKLGVGGVDLVRTIDDAVAELEEETYDIAILDVWIARKSCDAVANLAESKGAKVVLVSGDEPPPSLSGFAALRKPVAAEALRSWLTEATNG